MANIKNKNGFLKFSIEEGEIIIDMIEVFERRKGTGKKMIDELKSVAVKLDLPIVLIAVPQDETITKEGLINFYKSCGFDFHHDDVDYSYMILK